MGAGKWTKHLAHKGTDTMTAARKPGLIGILVGGGPAPGINSVIGAAAIQSIVSGQTVLGIRDGFRWMMEADTTHVRPLSIEEVSRIHFRGGSHLGTSRANPTTHPQHLETTLKTLLQLNIWGLITIGGDDTAFSALKLEQMAGGRLQIVHVPKTIDNDLDLPHGISTFGFQTARHVGVDLLKNLMVDAQTTSRWYFVVTMGRKAGHLALGVGKAAGATLTIIPEEFRHKPVRLATLVDILTGAIVKRLTMGRADGVAVLAEGLVEVLDGRELAALGGMSRDPHGHLRLAEVNIGEVLKQAVGQQLASFGLSSTIVEKNIGYELRCADPIPYDMEYTRDLGYCAAQFLLEGGNAAMVSIQNGRFTPIPFDRMVDPATGRTRVRMVDIDSESYHVARRFMIRLCAEDLEEGARLERHAATIGMTPLAFRERFAYLMGET
jgi:ATP-dependent phosphofructokinase / diphosphate-dependent phosphofructokinase